MVPIVLLDAVGGTYWHDFMVFVKKQLLDGRMISPEDMSLFKVTENIEEAVQEVVGFFYTYHSMRYVQDRLVLRLQHAPTPGQMLTINEKFADILVSGKFELLREPMEEERDETDLMHMPRLLMHFNRRSLGRLRQLIDWLNQNCRA